MTYKWVWADGVLELASGFAKGIHHYMLFEKAVEELGHEPESYNGGTFSEESFNGPQLDNCRITWPGEGNPPTADQIKFMIQEKLQRYQDREGMIIARVEDMRVTAAIEEKLREIAERHKPDGGYGDTCWNPETKTVLWVPADWTSNEEAEAARQDFMAVDGVETVEGDAEQGVPKEEPWVRISMRGYPDRKLTPVEQMRRDLMWAKRMPFLRHPDGTFTFGSPGEIHADLWPEVDDDTDVIYYDDNGDPKDIQDEDPQVQQAALESAPYVKQRIEDWKRQHLGASVEDTEPEYNFSFLKDPHDELYPPAFDGRKKITPRAKNQIKNHVLNALREAGFTDADAWIYFTVYGSGISYNWDEDGDFDVQMWVDINKYNDLHPDTPQTSDDLVASVRRVVQPVNFPSFEEIGLSEGKMLIQYYPKPGEGTKEENLSSKPYACYNLEEDQWLQRPQPLTPEFYGEHFLSVMQKAEDIAVQSEALLEELQRNTISWQFWKALIDERNDPRYNEAMETARANAEQEKAGVNTLFEGVFGGRAEAYSPEGEGINDERDLIQKLLEVWGVFQRLKHFARQPLPWEEQDLPPETKDEDGKGEDEGDSTKDSNKKIHGSLVKFADWSEIMQNAQWLRQNQMVQITSNGANHVEGTVGSQESPGVTYNTQFDRNDPNSSAITTWNCTCPWGAVSWGRTRQWKKYEGRPCKHTLAMFWQSQSQPLDEARPEAQGQGQLFNPSSLMPAPTPGGANQPPPTPLGTPPTAQPPTAAPPAPEQTISNPTPAQPPGPGSPSVAIPGALSKLKMSTKNLDERQGAFSNGQVVVLKIPAWGIDRDQNQQMVPVGALGEVLWSDDRESIAIFPLDSGILEPHLVRVQTETDNLRPSRAKTPFVRKR